MEMIVINYKKHNFQIHINNINARLSKFEKDKVELKRVIRQICKHLDSIKDIDFDNHYISFVIYNELLDKKDRDLIRKYNFNYELIDKILFSLRSDSKLHIINNRERL